MTVDDPGAAIETSAVHGQQIYLVLFDLTTSEESIVSEPLTGGSRTTIIDGLHSIGGIAADDTNVYFATTGSIMKCPLSGCTGPATSVAALQQGPYALVTNGQDLYYVDETSLLKCSVDGCGSTPTVLAARSGNVATLTLDAANVYWSDTALGMPGVVASCPLDGCGAGPTIYSNTSVSPYGVSADGSRVFWGEQQTATTVSSCPISGCVGAPTAMGVTSGLTATFADGQFVYWGDGHYAMRCSVDGCGEMPDIVAPGYVLASDSSGIYTQTVSPTNINESDLTSCPACGCFGALRADALDEAPESAGEVVVDGTRVYWVEASGESNYAMSVSACDVAQCQRTKQLVFSPSFLIHGLVATNQQLFMLAGGVGPSRGVWQCDETDCAGTAHSIATATGIASGLATDGASLFWVQTDKSTGEGTLMMTAPSSQQTTTIAGPLPNVFYASVAVDGSGVYFSAFDGTIRSVPKGGGATTLLATGLTNPDSLLVTGTTLWYMDAYAVYALDVTMPGSQRQIAPVSFPPEGQGNTLNSPVPSHRVAGSPDAIYWTDGGLFRATLSGADVTPLATTTGVSHGLAVYGGRAFFGADNLGLLSIPR